MIRIDEHIEHLAGHLRLLDLAVIEHRRDAVHRLVAAVHVSEKYSEAVGDEELVLGAVDEAAAQHNEAAVEQLHKGLVRRLVRLLVGEGVELVPVVPPLAPLLEQRAE